MGNFENSFDHNYQLVSEKESEEKGII